MKLWLTRDEDGDRCYALWCGDTPPISDAGNYYDIRNNGVLVKESNGEIHGIKLVLGECREVELVLKAGGDEVPE